jgi:hypothetical protein
LVSDVTLRGGEVENLDYRGRYPKVSELSGLLDAVLDWGFSTIHYNTHGEGRERLAEEIAELSGEVDFSKLGGFQFNVYAPPVSEVEKIKRSNDEKKIILQASRRVIDEHPNGEIVDTMRVYGDSIDYVLIDRSQGSGENLDVRSSIDLYRRLSSLKDLSIVFAGGLDGEGVRTSIKKIVSKTGTKNISIDAESKVKNNPGEILDYVFAGKEILVS